MISRLNILAIGQAGDAAVREVLATAGFEAQIVTVGERAELVARLTQDAWDFVLADFAAAALPPAVVLDELRRCEAIAACIVIAELAAAERAMPLICEGALDVIFRDRLWRLPPLIEREAQQVQLQRARKSTEAALRQSRELYRDLIEGIDQGFYISDRRSLFRYTNPAVTAIAEFTDDELRGTSCFRLVAEEDRAWVMADYFAAARRGDNSITREFRVRTRGGRTLWVEQNTTVVRDAHGAVVEYRNILRDIAERKAAEQVIRESERRYRELVAEIPGAVFQLVVTPAGRSSFQFISEGMRRIHPGLPVGHGDFSTDLLMNLIEPDARERVTHAIEEGTRTLARLELDLPLRAADGERRWIRTRAAPLRQKDGSVVWHGICLDITDSKHTEETLRHLSSSGRPAAGAAFEFVVRTVAVLLDAEYAFIEMATAAAGAGSRRVLCAHGKIAEGEGGPVEALPWGDAATPAPLECGEEAAQRFPADRFVRENLIEAVVAVPLLADGGRPVGWLGVARRNRIRETSRCVSVLELFAGRVVAEMTRQGSEQKFQDLFEFAPDAVLIVDPAGAITMVNRQAESVFGCARTDLVGSPIEAIVPHTAAEIQRTQAAGTDAPRDRRTDLARRASGVEFPAEISVSPLHTESGGAVTVVVRDVSERVEAEQTRARLETQLWEAQKMEDIGLLASGIAHDFNNVLTGIIGNAEMARCDVPASNPAHEALVELLRAAGRATDLVRQILTFSRKHTHQRKLIQLAPVVKEALQLLRASLPHTIDIRHKVEDGCPPVMADPTHIHQIVVNLGTNSWHAIGDRPGRIEVAEQVVTVDAAMAERNRDLRCGTYVMLSVTDTGAGMDRATCARIFEPFFTTKEAGVGTGLGLAVVRGIVQHHEGAITVSSEPGQGASFRIYLPAQAPAPAAEPVRVPAVPRGRGQHILFIDDEPSLARLGGRILERLGYRATTASSARRAVAIFEGAPDEFAAVVSDLTMPGMSGAELVACVLAVRPQMPVILMTGYTDVKHRDHARRLGVGEFITKPLTMRTLGETLGRVLKPGRQLTGLSSLT